MGKVVIKDIQIDQFNTLKGLVERAKEEKELKIETLKKSTYEFLIGSWKEYFEFCDEESFSTMKEYLLEGMTKELDNLNSIYNILLNNSEYEKDKEEDLVEIINYGKVTVMERGYAIKFYLECMNASEGAERERYVNVYMGLIDGKKVVHD